MLNIPLPRLMRRDLQEVGRIRPIRLGIVEKLTPLSTAEMTFPLDEAAVAVGMFAELHSASGNAGVYRITEVSQIVQNGGEYAVQMEHAVCTLADAVLPGYTELGGANMPIGTVIQKLLDKQTEKYWAFGGCDYADQLPYSWENENLLTALLSVASHLTDACWDFDFSARPWKISLKKMRADDACECRLNRNINALKIHVDRSELCTRITPLGYGEGVNQLNIKKVNGGVPYLDADTIGTWGIVHSVYTEPHIDKASTLKAAAAGILARSKHPTVSVELDAAEIYALTGESIDRFYPGRLCRLPLPDYGITMDERVIEINRNDVFGAPTAVSVTLANKTATATGTLAALSRKSAISDLYSQGAASQFAVSFADNADQTHPAQMKFYIDQDAIHVNAVKVKFETSAFRGYSKAAKAGGAGSTTSSSEKVEVKVYMDDNSSYSISCGYPKNPPGGQENNINYTGVHVNFKDSHKHNFSHTHSIDLNLDDLKFATTIPPHRHSVSIPAHSHEIEYGIFEGGSASSVTVKVDGRSVPAGNIKNGEFDAVEYLTKDEEGRIKRGAWHTVEFTPNGLTRITANAYIRTFIRSLTGAEV